MRPPILEICTRVAAHYGFITAEDIASTDRHKSVAEARQIAMWLAREKYAMSYPEIGREFKRDHTTVMSGVRRVARATGMVRVTALRLRAELGVTPLPVIDFGSAVELEDRWSGNGDVYREDHEAEVMTRAYERDEVKAAE